MMMMLVDAVSFCRQVLEDITANIGQQNVDELLREAEQMLIEIRRRDFSQKTHEAQEELARAIEGLRQSGLRDGMMGQGLGLTLACSRHRRSETECGLRDAVVGQGLGLTLACPHHRRSETWCGLRDAVVGQGLGLTLACPRH